MNEGNEKPQEPMKGDPGQTFSGLPLLYLRSVKVNEFIYKEVLENVDRLMEMIKERVLTYTKMDDEIFNKLRHFLTVFLLGQVQKLTRSKDYDDTEMIENEVVESYNKQALSLEMDGESLIVPDIYSVKVYKYVGAKDPKRKRNYEYSIYGVMRELFSLPLFFISMSYLNGANAERKFAEVIKDFIDRLNYVEGKVDNYKDDKIRFISKMRLAYAEIKSRDVKATKENMAKEMRMAVSTYKDQLREKFKLELNEQTGEIYDLTKEGKQLI
ncbi:MAG: hypothetical protein WAU11_02820 [Ignavibacteriaceae bacterium]